MGQEVTGSKYTESQLSRATSASDFADQAEDLEFHSGRIGGVLMAELGGDVATIKCLDKKRGMWLGSCGAALPLCDLCVCVCIHIYDSLQSRWKVGL